MTLLLITLSWESLIVFIFGAGGGGALWKFYDYFLKNKKLEFDSQKSYRLELKNDIDGLRTYATSLEEKYREITIKYNELIRDYTRLQISYEQLKSELEIAKEEIKELKKNN